MERARNRKQKQKGAGIAAPQIAEKVEVQEALVPAEVLGAEPLSLMPLSLRTSEALFAGNNGQSGLFDSLRRGNSRAFSLFNSALQPNWPHKALQKFTA